MSCSVVSVCHSLELRGISQIVRFAHFREHVRLQAVGRPIIPAAVPGSVIVSYSSLDRGYKVKITFSVTNPTPDQVCVLRLLSAMRLVAGYVDQHGNRKLAGSPDHPLTLSIYESAGSVSGTLTGESMAMGVPYSVL